MNEKTSSIRLIGRAVAGAILGAIVALIVPLIVDSLTSVSIAPDNVLARPWLFALTGAIVGSALGVCAGHLELRGLLKRLITGALLGIVVGALIGGAVYPGIMETHRVSQLPEPDLIRARTSPFFSRYIHFQRQGLRFGIILGFGLGTGAGFLFAQYERRITKSRTSFRR